MSYSFGMLSLYVRDIEKAKAFYVDFLGMEVVEAFSGPSFIFLRPAWGTPIALQNATPPPPELEAKPGGYELNLEVEDLDAALHEWKTRGIEIVSDIADMGAGRWFRARDSEGYIISVYQMYDEVKKMRQQYGM